MIGGHVPNLLGYTYGWCFPPTIRKPVSNLLGGHQPSENGTLADARENESINLE
jgi:hypothetical protein